MRLFDALKVVLAIPFSFFITFRACLLPFFMIADSYLFAAFFSLFHITIWVLHLKAKSSLTYIVAYFLLFGVMIAEWADCVFNEESIATYYARAVEMYFLGKSSDPYKAFIFDCTLWLLSIILLFVNVLDMQQNELTDFVFTETSSTKSSVCFTTTLTENRDGYFEDIYGDLQLDSYQPSKL